MRMSPNEINAKAAKEWLQRAQGNLALAEVKKPTDTAWEDLCFQAQQAAEKALKAVLQYKGVVFPYTHDLQKLIELLVNNGIDVPLDIISASVLSRYASQYRYPGDYDPVSEKEYRHAIANARIVLDWCGMIIWGQQRTTQ